MGIFNHLFTYNSSLTGVLKRERLSHKKSRYVFLLFLTLSGFLFTSCNDKYEDLRYEYSDYGIIHKNGEINTIATDRGAVVCPSVWNIPSEFKNNDRVLIYFNLLGEADSTDQFDYYVRINEIYKILTKDIIEYNTEISDSLGNDPVQLYNLWISPEFINFDFYYGAGAPNLKHAINLARHPEKTADNRILLEFRHNAFNDPYNYKYHGIVSFRAEELLTTNADSVLLRIKYNSLNNEETIDLTWFPQENKLVKPEINPTEIPLFQTEAIH